MAKTEEKCLGKIVVIFKDVKIAHENYVHPFKWHFHSIQSVYFLTSFYLISNFSFSFYYYNVLFSRTPEVFADLVEILNELLSNFYSLKENLRTRNYDECNCDAIAILQMADDILELSTAYMDFLHPIYLDVERHGVFNEEKCQQLRSKLDDVLLENKEKLQNEYDLLTKPKETED